MGASPAQVSRAADGRGGHEYATAFQNLVIHCSVPTIASMLLDHGASAKEVDLTVLTGYKDWLEKSRLLMRHGATVSIQKLAHLVRDLRFSDAPRCVERYLVLVKEAGVSLHGPIPGHDGDHILHVATRDVDVTHLSSREKILRLLLDSGADFMALDAEGKNPSSYIPDEQALLSRLQGEALGKRAVAFADCSYGDHANSPVRGLNIETFFMIADEVYSMRMHRDSGQ